VEQNKGTDMKTSEVLPSSDMGKAKHKAFVVGAGIQGVPLAWALQNKLNVDTVLIETDANNLMLAQQKITTDMAGNLLAVAKSLQEAENAGTPDIVVSAVPFDVNILIAGYCFNKGWRYCDLGGNPKVSKQINEMFQGQTRKDHSICFTDLGLAPGYVNIIAEFLYLMAPKAKMVNMYCGGLCPDYFCDGAYFGKQKKQNKLRYARVFSTQGLYNEYTEDCRVLEHGEIIKRPALEDHVGVQFPNYPTTGYSCSLEAFNTKGGAASSLELMRRRGVEHCRYQTLRWHGHLDYLKFMLEECKMDQAAFTKAIENATPTTDNDEVFIKVTADELEECLLIKSDENWTAMQKGTAFPTAVMASIMAEGSLDEKPCLDYSDVPMKEFNERCTILDI